MTRRGEFFGVRGKPPGGKGRDQENGLKCLACGSGNLKCTDSRPTTNGNRSRSYTCLDCGDRQKTLEIPTMLPPASGIERTRQLQLSVLADVSLDDLLAELRSRCQLPA